MGLLAFSNGAQAAKATNSISYDSRALATTLWYPDAVDVIRGVVVFTGGQGSGTSGDTRDKADNRFWQRFAESFKFGIVGTQFTGSYTDAGIARINAIWEKAIQWSYHIASSRRHPPIRRCSCHALKASIGSARCADLGATGAHSNSPMHVR
jgi:hypothetical protein